MTDTPKSASTFRRSLAGVLDFLTIFFVGGYLIAKLTGDDTSGGFSLNGAPALALFGLSVFLGRLETGRRHHLAADSRRRLTLVSV